MSLEKPKLKQKSGDGPQAPKSPEELHQDVKKYYAVFKETIRNLQEESELGEEMSHETEELEQAKAVLRPRVKEYAELVLQELPSSEQVQNDTETLDSIRKKIKPIQVRLSELHGAPGKQEGKLTETADSVDRLTQNRRSNETLYKEAAAKAEEYKKLLEESQKMGFLRRALSGINGKLAELHGLSPNDPIEAAENIKRTIDVIRKNLASQSKKLESLQSEEQSLVIALKQLEEEYENIEKPLEKQKSLAIEIAKIIQEIEGTESSLMTIEAAKECIADFLKSS